MNRLTQGLAALVCVAALGHFSVATANDTQAGADAAVTLDSSVTIDQSTEIVTQQSIPVKSCNKCGFIRDNDAKAFCYAKCEGRSNQCGFIRDNDKKAYCYAIVEGRSNQCGFIRDADLKAQCYAEVG